jgi:hypothetical protein
MAKSHRMTPARRAALKKAQAASARKRRGKGKGKLAAANRKNTVSTRRKVVGYSLMAAGYGAMAYAAYRTHKDTQRSKSNIRREGIRARNRIHASFDRKDAKAGWTNHGPTAKRKVRTAMDKNRKANYRQATRLRQMEKASQRGLYNAGLGSFGTRSIPMGTGRRKR